MFWVMPWAGRVDPGEVGVVPTLATADCTITESPSVPHLHEKIDFTVAIFVVHQERVLLVLHRRLGKWLPLGGHIELDEDPEQAALRETLEESGLEVELLGERPPVDSPGTRALLNPRFLDIHRIHETHEHIGMVYWARPLNRSTPVLAPEEHHDIRWCTAAELESLQPPLTPAVRWYAERALAEISRWDGPAVRCPVML